jgi:hypothetical protein
MIDERERNCLSYWFPRLQAASVPVPMTVLLDAGPNWSKMLGVADGPRFPDEFKEGTALIDALAAQIIAAAPLVGGYPLFLRTGHFSGKHDWENTCHVPDALAVAQHVWKIIEMSEMFGMFGELPYRTWAVRELLPTEPLCRLPDYGSFPLVVESRHFIRDGAVVCSHPYWPRESIVQGFRRGDLPDDISYITAKASIIEPEAVDLAARVATAFKGDGAWSVDVLPITRGFFVTDMAEADRSFHWDGCPLAASFAKGP